MKVRDLLKELHDTQMQYGEKFLDWDIYTEQITEDDKKYKRDKKGQKWEIVTDGDDWEYFKCHGFNTKMPKQKIFTINVNY